jgi:hypothetical protein
VVAIILSRDKTQQSSQPQPRSTTVEILVAIDIASLRSYCMPEVLRVRGFRFFFFSREGHEPRHIPVEQAERYAKFWLDPMTWWNRVDSTAQKRELHSIIAEHREKFIVAWDEHFGQ